jgi:hypothetical protein
MTYLIENMTAWINRNAGVFNSDDLLPDLDSSATQSKSEADFVLIKPVSSFEIDSDLWMGTKDRNVVFVYNVDSLPADRDSWASLTGEEWNKMFGNDSKKNAQIALIDSLNGMTNS